MECNILLTFKLTNCAPAAFWKQIMVVKNFKMGFIVLLSCLSFLAPVQCAEHQSATITELSFQNMNFGMNLYRKISSYHDKNIFFSPLSISTSFAALLLGSDGITHNEILTGLNLNQLERDDQPDLIPELFQFLYRNITNNGSLKLDQSMTFFVQQQFKIEKMFKDQIERFFDADIKSVDFTEAKASIGIINEYIKQKTGDKVTDMITNIDDFIQLMMVNTIFFQGEWEIPFNPNFTEKAPFIIDNYNVVQVPMMFIDNKFYMMEDVPLGVKVLKLPYQEGVSMLVLLPNKGMDYTVIDEEITAEKFRFWTKGLRKTQLEVHMPKFKLEQSYSLHHLLSDLGISNIFSNSANLTKLSKDVGLKVSEVLHKAVVEVDESGTKAAAATTVGIIPYSLPKSFTINRPFFFFIYHEETNCLLFMGRVIDPTKK
ncbi:protein Z-dependent protease inhibitor [Thalassophryne amazonica]|uniref:protein Z-dependent protease inhibitor n=1 Tax=Thalassophryne amazonica TaxID=390379 RepID=UPI001471649A|nr:protein Z-dependent protease inhibitor [Thalassophryne amazonica]